MRYINIAEVYKSQDDLNKALKSYEKALQLCCNHLPSIHPQLALIYELMGMVYIKKKDISGALHHFEESV
jgi:tetratricopeptide (TPR) repeat protein